MAVITAIGDSITYGISNLRWTYHLIDRLGGDTVTASKFSPWSGLDENQKLTAGDWSLCDAGISGDTTAEMLTRFDSDALGHATDYIVIFGGTNDAIQSIPTATTTANIDAMVAKAITAGKVPVLCTIPPYNGGTQAQRDLVSALNAWVLARGLAVIDFYAVLVTEGTQTSEYLSDGIHPTITGHELMGYHAISLSTFGGVDVPLPASVAADWRAHSAGYFRNKFDGTLSTHAPNNPLALATYPDGPGGALTTATGTLPSIPPVTVATGAAFVLLKLPAQGSSKYVLHAPGTAGSVNRWQIDAGYGTLSFAFYGADGVGVSAQKGGLVAGEWAVIGASWSATQIKAFVNGVPGAGVATDAANGVYPTIRIGCYDANTYQLGSDVARILLLDATPTDEEALAIYDSMILGASSASLARKLIALGQL